MHTVTPVYIRRPGKMAPIGSARWKLTRDGNTTQELFPASRRGG